jgi:four helix bundle protein
MKNPNPAFRNPKSRKEEMKHRTKQFALRVIRLVESLPRGQAAAVIGRQLLRAGTSVGANYRAACRAKSTADFISKMGTVEEEADESPYWMELLVEDGIVPSEKLEVLMKEADELVAITVASINTAKRRSGR